MRASKNAFALVIIGAVTLAFVGGCASRQSEKPMLGQSVGSYMDDAYLTSAIKTKLLGNAGLKSFHVHVVTKARVVTLTGSLPSDALRDEAVRVAKSVDGVVKVISELEIKPPQQ